ncbi:hypothetical protein ACVBKF_01130 [Shewanella sp. 0m-11]
MLHDIEKWIDEVNREHGSQRTCCVHLHEHLRGFYPKAFLEQAFYVVVEELPRPQFLAGQSAVIDNFLNQPLDGITYKNTYYLLPDMAKNLNIHFHELVHVAQWRTLGVAGFITRYMAELAQHGYRNAPLEVIAYGLEDYFMKNGTQLNVLQQVELDLKRQHQIEQHH